MIVKLSPQRRDEALEVTRYGDALIINGTALDFASLPDGATLPNDAIDCEWIVGDVERVNGILHIMLLLPHAHDASEAARSPEPIANPKNGPLELPK